MKSAVIVGGGIAGLAAAPILVGAGWDVRVLEKSDEVSAGGTALGMWPEALRALDAVGVGDAVRSASVEVTGARFLRPDGSCIARLGAKHSARLVPRPDLLEALAAASPTGVVEFGRRVEALSDVSECDVIIAADGINSAIRSEVFGPEGTPIPLGAVAWRGTVDGPCVSMTETWGRGKLFGTTPHDSRRTNWFASVRRTELGEGESMAEHFASWHGGVSDVVARIDQQRSDFRELAMIPSMKSWVRGNVALVGDAAHAMAPNLGRGACESLLDAVALASSLVEEETVAGALRRYDAARRRRAYRISRASSLAGSCATARRWTRARDLLAGGLVRIG
ncbi:FAD-dependent monooxygenase [Rhodococcoides fascians]|uniref:FAD-dependent monooxygenase n=1 Tax=Rhodococcoides fascians TaxID=1828 RepID=UPI00055CEA59|nr:FAD-dependent monooxygenase [Rhodococcus fascians]